MAQPARAHARTLASILLEANVVQHEQVEAGLIRQRSTGLRIGETLVEMGAATEEDIGWALARQLDLPFVDPRPEAMDHELIRSFPDGVLLRLDAVPLVKEDARLTVALADPTDMDIVGELERVAGLPLALAVATPSAIRKALSAILGPRRDQRAVVPPPISDARFNVKWDRSGESFLLFHLREAARDGADEIHFLARGGSIEVHYRLGGRLVQVGNEPPGAMTYLLTRIEGLGGPVLDDRATHVTGHVSCPTGSETVDLGISLLSQEEGISVTLTWKTVPTRPPRLEDLGFNRSDLVKIREALKSLAGLAIVTGPPRSGGSTTLACLLAEAGIRERRCLAFGSAGSPIPATIRVQAPTAEAKKTWAEVAVAQCADLVVLDGVLEGAAVTDALSAKTAGRLVLLRTDWTDTFALLEYLAATAQGGAAIADRLCCIIQQRLLRSTNESRPTNGSHQANHRLAVFEVLVPTDSLREALRAGDAAARLRARAEADGLRPLSAHLESLVASGRVSVAETERFLA